MAELKYLGIKPLIKFPILVNSYGVNWKRKDFPEGTYYRPEGEISEPVERWWVDHVGVIMGENDIIKVDGVRDWVVDLPPPQHQGVDLAIIDRVVAKVRKEQVEAEPEEKVNPNTVAGFFRLKRHAGLFGLEIEIEGNNFPDIRDSRIWKGDKDGSLRGENREYILKKPADEAGVKAALMELNKAFDEAKTVKEFSFRTSVHVHVNVQDMTKNEIARFLYLSHLLEAPLVHFSGAHREGNRFCLRATDAPQQYENLETMLFNKSFNYVPDIQQAKYAAINLVPIKELGSVEFRSMRGTCDTDLIMEWIGIINRIRTMSLKFHNVKEIADLYLAKGPAALFKKVFTPNQRKLLKYPEMEEKIRTAFSYMINIPYMYKEV